MDHQVQNGCRIAAGSICKSGLCINTRFRIGVAIPVKCIAGLLIIVRYSKITHGQIQMNR